MIKTIYLFLIALLFLSGAGYAQTIVEYSVGARADRDFHTLSEWFNARKGDLVDRNTIEKAVCYDDAPMQDTLNLSTDYAHTDADHYFWITVCDTCWHKGSTARGFVLRPIPGVNLPVIRCSLANTVIEKIRFDQVINGQHIITVQRFDGQHFQQLLFANVKQPDGSEITDQGDCIYTEGSDYGTITVQSCVFYNIPRQGICANGTNNSNGVTVKNCTVMKSQQSPAAFSTGAGISARNVKITAYNTISIGDTYNDWQEATGDGWLEGDYNIGGGQGDAHPPGSNSLDNQSMSDIFVSTNNYHIRDTGNAYHNGISDNVSSANDIDGDPFGSTPSIGADEYTAPVYDTTYVQIQDPGVCRELVLFINVVDAGQGINFYIQTMDPVSQIYDTINRVYAGEAGPYYFYSPQFLGTLARVEVIYNSKDEPNYTIGVVRK